MNREQRFWYLDELVMQGLGASVAYDSFLRYMRNDDTKQSLLVWSALSTFFAHTGIISKILHSPRRASKDRAHILIEALQLPELDELQNRAGRNNIEHIDERTDNFAARDTNSLVSMVIPDRQGYEYLCTSDKAIRRVLIESELIFVSEDYKGNRIETDLPCLRAEARMVLEKAHEKMLE
jgi:hypothetical protein